MLLRSSNFSYGCCQPLELVELTEKLDLYITVSGGGISVKLAQSATVSPVLLWNTMKLLRPALRAAGYVTRDARWC
ncbi:30S ribosomal protein S9 [Vibrio lentus]|nr:30S ribosomal protein S9 [Vibrio lentus]